MNYFTVKSFQRQIAKQRKLQDERQRKWTPLLKLVWRLWPSKYLPPKFADIWNLELQHTRQEMPISFENCKACGLGKIYKKNCNQNKRWQLYSKSRKSISDVNGPVSPLSIGWSCYVIIFINEFNRYKIQVCQRSKKFIGSYAILNVLRTDNGADHKNGAFSECGVNKKCLANFLFLKQIIQWSSKSAQLNQQ